jgi:hypothetical protein
MRKTIAALTVALSIFTLTAPAAQAAPAEVHVRIEGRSETLFEGPILTEGHNVKASSDKAWRRCNGLNNGQNPLPGPTPTAASADAMSLLGEGFDGNWYAEPFEDYFITRWGPDGQNGAKAEYWGLVVNNAFTSVGGCQYQVDGGDEVLWVYDAFGGRPRLALYPAGYPAGAVPLTAQGQLGVPFEVEVEARDGYNEAAPPPSPQRSGAEPFEGAEVAPVIAGPSGFEKVDTSSAATVETGEDGLAEIAFAEVGWQRIKATVAGSGEEAAVRSNRLDVCVTDPPLVTDCGPLPPDDLTRIPPPVEEESEPEPPGSGVPAPGPGQAGVPAKSSTAATAAGQVRLRLSRLDRSRVADGVVKLSWRVLDPGPGIAKWTVSSLRLGRKGARYLTRASGGKGTAATLRLPPGATYRLRLAVTDVLERGTAASIGKVQVP